MTGEYCVSNPPGSYKRHLVPTAALAAALDAGSDASATELCERLGGQAPRRLDNPLTTACGRTSFGPFEPLDEIDDATLCANCRTHL